MSDAKAFRHGASTHIDFLIMRHSDEQVSIWSTYLTQRLDRNRRSMHSEHVKVWVDAFQSLLISINDGNLLIAASEQRSEIVTNGVSACDDYFHKSILNFEL